MYMLLQTKLLNTQLGFFFFFILLSEQKLENLKDSYKKHLSELVPSSMFYIIIFIRFA